MIRHFSLDTKSQLTNTISSTHSGCTRSIFSILECDLTPYPALPDFLSNALCFRFRRCSSTINTSFLNKNHFPVKRNYKDVYKLQMLCALPNSYETLLVINPFHDMNCWQFTVIPINTPAWWHFEVLTSVHVTCIYFPSHNMWQWRCFDTIRRREKKRMRESPLKNRVVYNTMSYIFSIAQWATTEVHLMALTSLIPFKW